MIKKGKFFFMEDPPCEAPWRATQLGDALSRLKTWKDGTVDCWITSPPYYRQIDYDHPDQCGLESNLHQYLDYQMAVAGEMFRASKESAVMFWVIRDTSNKTGGPGGDYRDATGAYRISLRGPNEKGIPRKSQLLVPERMRLMFSAVGWVPVMVVIWDKKDSRRGSITKPSYSYEHVLVFAKTPDHYWDRESVLQEYADASLNQLSVEYTGQSDKKLYAVGAENPSDTKRNICESMKRKPGAYLRQVWDIPSGSQPRVLLNGKKIRGKACFPLTLAEICVCIGCPPGGVVADPYMGLGTTMIASTAWGRHFMGIELNKETLQAAGVRFAEWQARSGLRRKVA